MRRIAGFSCINVRSARDSYTEYHKERVMWLVQHVGPTRGGRFFSEYGLGWKVKWVRNHGYTTVYYEILDEKHSVFFQLRFS